MDLSTMDLKQLIEFLAGSTGSPNPQQTKQALLRIAKDLQEVRENVIVGEGVDGLPTQALKQIHELRETVNTLAEQVQTLIDAKG
jgi:hypothetical protein